jgi:cation/acetate symporter
MIAIAFFLVTVAITLVITYFASRKSKSRADMYAAGGKLTGGQNGLAISGDFMSATTFLGMTGYFFDTGVDPPAIYYLTPLVGLCLMLLLLAAPLRRAGKFTLGDVMSNRLQSDKLRLFAGVSTVTISTIYLVGQLIGAGILIRALFNIDFSVSVVLIGTLMTLYVAAGGMLAATWVQIVKALLLVLVVIAISVFCVIEGGGLAAIYARAADIHPLGWNLYMPGAGKNDLFSALSLAIGMSVGMLGLPHLLIRFFTVPTEKEASRSAVAATLIIGGVFLLLFLVIGPAAVSFVYGNPLYVTETGAPKGGVNMASIHLANALGGEVLMGVTSAVAFATILAVVAGLVMATASAASHDIYAVARGKAKRSEKEELLVFRLATVVMAIVSVSLAFAFQHENVAFLTALAFGVAASANFPVLILILYWKRLTTAGALAGGLTGLITSVGLITVGPSVWVKVLHHSAPLFPSDYPALLTAPLAFVAAIVVSLATKPRAQVREGAPA